MFGIRRGGGVLGRESVKVLVHAEPDAADSVFEHGSSRAVDPAPDHLGNVGTILG